MMKKFLGINVSKEDKEKDKIIKSIAALEI